MSISERASEVIAEDETALNKGIIEPLKKFFVDSHALWVKCDKPDRKDFMKVMTATGMGFVVLGGLGFVIKLIHIPINNILVGGQ